MLSFIMLVFGFVLLVWGADKFVAGASALARRLGVSPLLVGLTIVAFGTSAPELAVSLTAALQGANEIAVGNVLGSNIFNLLVVAGLSAVVCPLVMDRTLLRRDWPLSVGAAILLLIFIAPDLTISRIEGIILLVVFALVLGIQIRAALKNRSAADEEEDEVKMPPVMIGVNIVLGLACIIIGGQLAVNGATGIARMFGLSETLIGLTIVAIGTSLPELVTSLVAARKGQNEIAMGNVIGSNIFNLLLILGVSATITPIPVQATSIIDALVLIGISIVFYLPARRGKLGRAPGAIMALTYVVYTAYLIMR
ncbi:calcium/sodium antiporter [Agathobaculum sp. Marseille-P7918]|uniref:calcium/sodium antiporter n=1 Tax=Agathobaculum sp. Marseille-P7918 TaxID=2479843 RepID=UPI000F63A991|nr:calcium/sodium antiporter [Agathobaculum sp. Marseille-P7918]